MAGTGILEPTIGIDIGGTKIAGAVVDRSGEVLERCQVPTDGAVDAIVAAIVKVARDLKAAVPAVGAVGVGAAGLVDSSDGVILWAPNVAYQDLYVGEVLEEHLSLRVIVDNDANVAAWGEATHGAGRGVRDQIMVTVGTGIGGGLVLGGVLYRGAHGLAAEIGHQVVQPDGPLCGCGRRGCWEAVASGSAIGRLARQEIDDAVAASPASGSTWSGVLDRVMGDSRLITGLVVGEAALEGDEFARDIVSRVGQMFGVGLANLVNIFDPEMIVVGGGAGSALGELFLGPAREVVDASVEGREWRPPVALVPAALGADAGVIGAAALARDLLPR